MNNLSRNCYTYLVTFTHPMSGEVKKYYGSRTARGCDPSEIGVGYKTSSSQVQKLISEHGLSHFTWEVTDTFGEDILSCLDYESRMIEWLGAVRSPDWLNRHDGQGTFSMSGVPSPLRGVSPPETVIEKLKLASKRGRRHTEEVKRGFIEKVSEPFTFISPEGVVYEGKNTRKFCRDMGLPYSTMIAISRYGQRPTKGKAAYWRK